MKNMEADVVVISAGSAGLTAAVAAAERGAKVIALEKSKVIGGTANKAMGLFAVESRLQRMRQMNLTREEAFKIHMDFTQWHVDARLVKTYIDKSADTIDWLEKMGVEFADIGCHGVGNYYTWHIVKGVYTGFGQRGLAEEMMKRIAYRAEELGVEIHLNTLVTKILKDDGRVTGVIAQTKDNQSLQVNAGAVIIACGGSGGMFASPEFNAGDGLRMAKEAGAAVRINETKSTPPRLPPMNRPPNEQNSDQKPPNEDERDMIGQAFAQPNLVVNLQGERFMNEEVWLFGPYQQNAVARQQDGIAFMIFDEDTKNYYVDSGFDFITAFTLERHIPRSNAQGFDEIIRRIPKGGFQNYVIAASVEELAEQTGISLQGLQKTIEEYNLACDTGRDKAFNKNARYLRPVQTPNFYSAGGPGMKPGMYEGIKINYKTEVLTEDYKIIPRLYAAGIDTACNVYYDVYPNILPGNNLGYAINTGRMAGENAVDYVKTLKIK